MKKKQKIDYINSVFLRFHDAQNHGNSGSWWYPKPNVIAYNVKIYAGLSIDELRKAMTARQNDYYSDNSLYEICSDAREVDAQFFRDDICNTFDVVSAHYAGRSGGWLEVEFDNTLEELDSNGNGYNYDASELSILYRNAVQLEKLESKVAEYIKDAIKKYKVYCESEDYISYLLESILTDDAIAEIYKAKITSYANKLI